MKKLLYVIPALVLLLGITFSYNAHSTDVTLTIEDIDKALLEMNIDQSLLERSLVENCEEEIAAPPCYASFWGQIDGLNENEVGWLRIKNYNTGQNHIYYIPYGYFNYDVVLTKGKLYGMKLCNKIPNINFPGNDTNAWISACNGTTWVVGDCHEHYFIP